MLNHGVERAGQPKCKSQVWHVLLQAAPSRQDKAFRFADHATDAALPDGREFNVRAGHNNQRLNPNTATPSRCIDTIASQVGDKFMWQISQVWRKRLPAFWCKNPLKSLRIYRRGPDLRTSPDKCAGDGQGNGLDRPTASDRATINRHL